MQQSSTNSFCNRRWTVGLVGLIVLCSISAVLYRFGRSFYAEHQVRRLLESAYNIQRPGGGRLFGSPYSPISNEPSSQPDLGRAQILVLRHPDPATRQRLQEMLYLASASWQAFTETVRRLPRDMRENPTTLNNLGVSFLALSEMDPTYLLKALDEFEHSAKLAPKAPEPLYNLVITYRKLRLSRPADEMLQRYTELDSRSMWYRELTDTRENDESTVLNDLRRAAETNDLRGAERAEEVARHVEIS